MRSAMHRVTALIPAVGSPEPLRHILCLCIVTRIMMILALILSNICLPDHNATGVYTFELEDIEISNVWLSFTKWDAAYFLQIARNGYQFESSFAFFPLYPLCIKFVGMFIAKLTSLSDNISTIVAGVVVSNVCFVITVALLWFLLKELQVTEKVRVYSVFLFCLNPANVFFASIYSESFYSCFAFGGMLFWEKRRYAMALLLFLLASSTRSNGIFNVIFLLCHVVVKQLMAAFRIYQGNNYTGGCYFSFFWKGVMIGIAGCVCTLPYIMYSAYSHRHLCPKIVADGSIHAPVLLSLFSPFEIFDANLSTSFDSESETVLFQCSDQSFIEVYGSIQYNYWNVGFMRYYSLKQLPNFFLASPVLLICGWILKHYFEIFSNCLKSSNSNQAHQKYFKTLYMFLLDNGNMIPYLVHMMAVVLVAIFYSHIQISTRLIFSSCPLVCYHICHLIDCYDQSDNLIKARLMLASGSLLSSRTDVSQSSTLAVVTGVENLLTSDCQPISNRFNVILGYFIVFNVLGILMHPNSLPWT
jgi:phosphatidylinositol glycan class V